MSSELLLAVAGNAAGGEATYVEDVFSTHLYEGNESTQLIENGIALSDANSGGSVEFDGTGDYLSLADDASLQMGSGDFTIEAWIYINAHKNYNYIYSYSYPYQFLVDNNGNLESYFNNDDNSSSYVILQGSSVIPTGTWTHVAVVRNGSSFKQYINGVEDGSNTSSVTLAVPSSFDPTIGDWGGTGYVMNGYISNLRVVKGTAVYTSAFTPSTTAFTDVSGTSLLTCQGDTPFVDNSSNAHTITVNGDATAKAFGPFTSDTEGKGGLVWIKGRTGTAKFNSLVDSERGNGKLLFTDLTSAEVDYGATGVVLNSNGFSVDSNQQNLNGSGQDMCSWTFAKQEKFFDVVTYTGTGSVQNISHNLGSVPGMVIVKSVSATNDWFVWHREMHPTAPDAVYMRLTTSARASNTTIWNNTSPTATDFTVGANGFSNFNGREYVAYLFAHNDGDGDFGETGNQDIIKCGSYTGTGSAQTLNLGFEPQWILIKQSSGTNDWNIWDNMRGLTAGGTDAYLRPNLSSAEDSSGSYDFLSPTATGVTVDPGSNGYNFVNTSGQTYIYIAIRRGPMKTPESGTEVFTIDTAGSTGDGAEPRYRSTFPVDFALVKNSTSSGSFDALARLVQGRRLRPADTSAEDAYTNAQFDYMNGWFSASSTASSVYSWMFRRAPGFFDVVAYEGTGSEPRTVNHNLGVAPEMIWTKRRDSGSLGWVCWHKDLTTNSWLRLDTADSELSSPSAWGGTFSADNYTIANDPYDAINGSGGDFIAYLFATVPGVSKVGSVSHTSGTDTNVDCGFTNGARFVVIKSKTVATNWFVFDTARGIVTGNDPFLRLDATNAQTTTLDMIDPYSSGFTIAGNGSINTGDHIFLAIA